MTAEEKQYRPTEENYIKHILLLSKQGNASISTKHLAEKLKVSAASITNMIQRLEKAGLITYQRYYGVQITPTGKKLALKVLRKHRLWETFLFHHLNFDWSEVHPVAEELEHITSEKLVTQLEAFLGFPKTDPHGDPIPSATGALPVSKDILLSKLKEGETAIFRRVLNGNPEFLSYLKDLELLLGASLEMLKYYSFDSSFKVRINRERSLLLSKKVAEQLLVEPHPQSS